MHKRTNIHLSRADRSKLRAVVANLLATIFQALDLKDVALFGFFMGGGEVARYIGRHGTSKISKAGLISAVPPLMLQTPKNPDGIPLSAFDGIRAGVRADRSQSFKTLSSVFFGASRDGAKVSQGTLDWFWFMAMQASIKGTLNCIKAFSETDFTEDLKNSIVQRLSSMATPIRSCLSQLQVLRQQRM